MFLPLIWARIYGCLCSAGKLRPVSPTHKNEEMDVPLGSQPKKELTSASNLIFLSMNEQLKSDLLKQEADEFWQECETKAAELEVTVDYYLDEFL